MGYFVKATMISFVVGVFTTTQCSQDDSHQREVAEWSSMSDGSGDDKKEHPLSQTVGRWSLLGGYEEPARGFNLDPVAAVDDFIGIERALWDAAKADDPLTIKAQFQGVIWHALIDGIREKTEDAEAHKVLCERGIPGALRMLRNRNNGSDLKLPERAIDLLVACIQNEGRVSEQCVGDVVGTWQNYAAAAKIDLVSANRVTALARAEALPRAAGLPRLRRRLQAAGQANPSDQGAATGDGSAIT